MIPAAFDYARPSTVDEALQAIAAGGEDVKILAGGQSLIPVMRLRLAAPETVVDLTRVSELRGVRDDGDAIVIGAMTTHSDVLADPLVAEHAPLIAAATETVADRQVRHRGTFGGALAHADPAGDLPAVALALDAEFVVAGPGGRRTVPAAEFFVDYLTTALAEGEVLVEVRIPKLSGTWGMHYEKFNRVAQAWSIVAVAAVVRREGDRIAEARMGLTNMGPTPLRASGVEAALARAEATQEAGAAGGADAAEGTSPSSDLNGQADYREHLVTVLTRRAVAKAAGLWRRDRGFVLVRSGRFTSRVNRPETHRPRRSAVQLENSFTVPVPVDEAWRVLLDIERIAPCMPGAPLDTVDGDDFTGRVKVKLGPINLTYQGKASFIEKDEAAHKAVIDARGKDQRGNGTAAAVVTAKLAAEGAITRVDVLTDLNITGRPAQFGRGVMTDVGNKLLGQFADKLAAQLREGDAQGDAARASAASSVAATATGAVEEVAASAEQAAGNGTAGKKGPAATKKAAAAATDKGTEKAAPAQAAPPKAAPQ